MNSYRNNPEGEENQQATRDNESYVKSLKFDRHALDDALTHNANLKVGGLETPCPVCAKLMIALEESVKLQSFYGQLLNTYDGGERMKFDNAEEWLMSLQLRRTLP